jgi:hypothetical protein
VIFIQQVIEFQVSIDKNDWVRVIDHTHYLCRSRQNLLFEERVIKYIRYHSINFKKYVYNLNIKLKDSWNTQFSKQHFPIGQF